MKSKAELYAKICLMIAWAVLPLAISWQVVYGPKHLRGYLDENLKPVRTWASTTGGKVTTLLDNANEYAESNQEATVSITRATAASVRHLDEFVVNLNANVNGGQDFEGSLKPGLIQDIHVTLTGVQDLIGSVKTDLNGVSQAAQKVGPVLDNLAGLAKTLDQQISSNGTASKEVLASLKKGLDDLDVLLAGDDLKDIFRNLNTTTYHLGESAKSVDLAFQKLRQRLGLIKSILVKAVNIVKVTIPLP